MIFYSEKLDELLLMIGTYSLAPLVTYQWLAGAETSMNQSNFDEHLISQDLDCVFVGYL